MTESIKRIILSKMNKFSYIVLFVSALLMGAGVYQYISLKNRMGETSTQVILPIGSDFALNKSVSEKVSLSNFKGKVVLLYFGYTYCPDICPTGLMSLGTAYKMLTKKQKEKVQIIFITVDPIRDTFKRLAQYTPYFEPSILALRGTKEEIDKVTKSFAVFYEIYEPKGKDKNSYLVDHTTKAILLNSNGKVVDFIEHNEDINLIKNKIIQTLN